MWIQSKRRCGSALAYVTAINGDVRFSVILTEISQEAALLFFKTIKELEWRADYNPAVMQYFLRGVNALDLNKSSRGVTFTLLCPVKISVLKCDFFFFLFFSPSHFCLILNGLEE